MPHTPEQKRELRKKRREENPEKYKEQQRRQNLKHFFGITLEQYDEILENQNGNCAICERHFSEFKRRLAVDHCHDTGKVRGLLCDACNSGLGKLRDDRYYLEAAINYLENGPRFLTRVERLPNVPEVT